MRNVLIKIFKKIDYLITNRFLHLFIDPLERWRNSIPRSLSIVNTTQGWSMVIITGADNLSMLEQVLSAAEHELAGGPAEIILVGPVGLGLSRRFAVPIKHIVYSDAKFLPALITRKKNLGVQLCQYDKVVVCHDYIALEPGWKQGWDKFGDDFEVAVNPIKNFDGSRYRDWLVWDYPGLGPGLLPYNAEITQYQYINGPYFVVKRNFYLAHPLNEKLRWGEGEDVEWSKRIRSKTTFKLNPHSQVRCAKPKEAHAPHWIENTEKLQKIFK